MPRADDPRSPHDATRVDGRVIELADGLVGDVLDDAPDDVLDDVLDEVVDEVVDDASAAETFVFARPKADDRLKPDSATRLQQPRPVARPMEVATVRERPSGPSSSPEPGPRNRPAAPPTDARVAPPAPVIAHHPSEPAVSVAHAPIDDLGFSARYTALGSLGEGGMGTIALCRDARIGRDVAMKSLRREAADADARMRFEREARVQGQLEHPAIVPVYDLGVAPDGTPFFTMKRLRGETLSNIMAALQKGDPAAVAEYPRRRLLQAYCQVCQAVAFANVRGVMHRDLKPSNIMLGDFGEVYVLDWGLAKLTNDSSEDARIIPASAHKQTLVGEVMGTPGYMSPEQLRGEVDRIDARSDVYTLGVVLFEMLTLEPLHDRTGLDTMYNSTLGKLDQRLSERAHKKAVPSELCAVCIRATELDPAARFSSVRELHEAVERFLEGSRDAKSLSELAAKHAKTAVEAAILARRDPEMRELAIRELGAALTLDPNHAGAIETLSRLVLEVPAGVTAAVRQELDTSRQVTERTARRAALALYGLWLGLGPLVLVLGVEDRVPLVVSAIAVIAATAGAVLHALGRLGPVPRFALHVVGAVAVASCCTVMGWAVLVPALAAVHTAAFVLFGDKRFQPAALAVGALSIVVPFALQEAQILPPAYAFRNGRMVVLPFMTALPPVRTQLFLLIASLGAILAPAFAIARLRDALEAAEARAVLNAHALGELVPAGMRDIAGAVRKSWKRP